MFKVGDIVQHKAGTPYHNDSIWGYEGKVISFNPEGDITVLSMLDGPRKNVTGGFLTNELELVDVNKSLSDNELADKYRRLRQEARDTAEELKNRGYATEFLSSVGWRVMQLISQDFRFTKTETVTVIL